MSDEAVVFGDSVQAGKRRRGDETKSINCILTKNTINFLLPGFRLYLFFNDILSYTSSFFFFLDHGFFCPGSLNNINS